MKVLPEDREEDALEAVGEVARAEAAAEEPGHALLVHHRPHGLAVPDGLRARLLGGLDDAQAVGARVGDEARGEPQARIVRQPLNALKKKIILDTFTIGEIVVGRDSFKAVSQFVSSP